MHGSFRWRLSAGAGFRIPLSVPFPPLLLVLLLLLCILVLPLLPLVSIGLCPVGGLASGGDVRLLRWKDQPPNEFPSLLFHLEKSITEGTEEKD